MAALTLLLLTFLVFSAGEATCYSLASIPIFDEGPDRMKPPVPCDPSAKVSYCCTVADYCIGNGLCLDAGGDSCTDPDWPSPRHGEFRACADSGKWVPIWMCRSGSRVADYCCDGLDAQCCVDALLHDSSTLASNSTSSTTFRPPSPSRSDQETESLDKAGIIGVVVAAIGVLVTSMQRKTGRENLRAILQSQPTSYWAALGQWLRRCSWSLQRHDSQIVLTGEMIEMPEI